MQNYKCKKGFRGGDPFFIEFNQIDFGVTQKSKTTHIRNSLEYRSRSTCRATRSG